MSAPYPDLASSISSTGHEDGLGRRALSFDRESGAMLEHLFVRPELAVYERLIRERVDQLTAFDDDRFARPLRITRDADTGELAVVSPFVSGHRISDLLETSHDSGAVPGVDVALGYLLDALPGLSALHSNAGFTHGLIDPARSVLTPAGRVVLLDAVYGGVVQRLGLSNKRLWTNFGIAAPGISGTALDATIDVSQTALTAVMLVLGRVLGEDEYPEAIPTLLMEVVEVAQIRGSSGFASGLQRILQRSLPLPGRRAYASAEEMLVDVRQLVRREIGVEVCRRALRDFVEQMNASLAAATVTDLEPDESSTAEEQDLTSTILEERNDPDQNAAAETPVTSEAQSLGDALEFEIRLETEDTEPLYELPSLRFGDRLSGSPALEHDRPAEPTPSDRARNEPDLVVSIEPAADAPPREEFAETAVSEIDTSVRPKSKSWWSSAFRSSTPRSSYEPVVETIEVDVPAPAAVEAPHEADASTPEPVSSSASAQPEPEIAAQELVATDAAADARSEESEEHSGKQSRRKRHQQKSARARKDKLRSTAGSQPTILQPAAAAQAPAAEPAAAPKPPSKSGWLVPPDRAAAFEQVAPPPPPAAPIAPPPQPPPFAQPSFAAPMPVYAPPPPTHHQGVAPPPPAPVHATPRYTNVPPTRSSVSVSPVSTPVVKVKVEPPSGYDPPKSRRAPQPSHAPLEPVTTLPTAMRGPMFGAEEPRGFPWKLAIAVLVVVALGIAGGRFYLASHAAKDPTAGTTASSEPIAPEPEPAAVPPPSKNSGQIVVQTQPAGAKVLLDGKAAGESPVTLNVAPGRHLVTLISSSGSVKQTVRVAAGKSVTIDQPIFSGWLAIFAPIALTVSEGGKPVGSSEQNRLMVAPGHHSLTFTNTELGYTAVQEVDVNAGEVTSVTIKPVGAVNFNSSPWAEVWNDGRKIGDTPIANLMLPLGDHEFLFKNALGQRRVTATIRADQPTAVSVDFNKPPH